MEHLYTKSSNEDKTEFLNPQKETIQFLLSYSKALRVIEYKEIKFETLLN